MLCVLPSAVVLIWTAWRGGKGHQRACAAELSHTVGLNIACAAVSFPRPGITLYQGVELSDPETASPLARMRFLETGGSGTTSVWVASQPELDAAQLRDFWLLVDQRLREASDTAATTRISAAEATLHWPAGAQTLTDIVGQISMPADGEPRTAMLSFRIAGIDMPEPVRLRVTRQRDSTPTSMAGARGSQLKTKLEFDTCGGALPCAMLAVPLGIANHLGTQAKFRGSVWATETADGWDGELSGQFTDVDLQILVSEQFPHRLSGAAEITVQKARFRHGRLEEAAGTLSAGPGVVSQSLVAAAIEFLHLAPRPANHHAEDMLRQYEQLSLAFVVDASGLTLHGQCSGAAGAVMRLGDGTVLSEPAGSSGPIAALVRTLVPQSAVQVPATRESGWLIGRLPVPQVVLREDQPPQGRLRLERNP
jgi:hypothetical protein